MADAFHIRVAHRDDYQALAAMWRDVDELHARLLPAFFRRPEGPARTREDVDRILRAPDERLLVAAADDGTVAGLVHAQLYDTPAVAVMVPKRRAHVDSLVVAEAFRRRGLGLLLMQAAAAWARELGASELLLTVWAGNEPADRFYQALGFQRINSVLGKEL